MRSMCVTLSCIAAGIRAVHTSAGSVRWVSTSITPCRSNSEVESWPMGTALRDGGGVVRMGARWWRESGSERGRGADDPGGGERLDLGVGVTGLRESRGVVLAEQRCRAVDPVVTTGEP